MGTRSRIGVMHGDNCKSVYCHWDSYLDHNGRILLENYDSSKANFLVALGDISSLGTEIGEKHDFDVRFTAGAIGENWTKFYGRDRGEEGTEFKTTDTFEKFLELCDNCGAEFYYIMRDGEWFVGTTYSSDTVMGGKLVPLATALADHDIERGHDDAMTHDIVEVA